PAGGSARLVQPHTGLTEAVVDARAHRGEFVAAGVEHFLEQTLRIGDETLQVLHHLAAHIGNGTVLGVQSCIHHCSCWCRWPDGSNPGGYSLCITLGARLTC